MLTLVSLNGGDSEPLSRATTFILPQVYRQIEKRSSKTAGLTSAAHPLRSPASEYLDILVQGVGFPSQHQDLSDFGPRGPSSAPLRMSEGATRERSVSSASGT